MANSGKVAAQRPFWSLRGHFFVGDSQVFRRFF
jgi:hypothetical protein